MLRVPVAVQVQGVAVQTDYSDRHRSNHTVCIVRKDSCDHKPTSGDDIQCIQRADDDVSDSEQNVRCCLQTYCGMVQSSFSDTCWRVVIGQGDW